MTRVLRVTAMLLVALMVIDGCGSSQKTSASPAAEPSAQPAAAQPAAAQPAAAQPQPSQPAPAVTAPARSESAAKPAAKSVAAATSPATAAPATQAAAPAKADQNAPETIILKGAPLGGVKFLHTAHSKDRNLKCETCHHAAKPDSPAAASAQRCTDCHTPVAKPPIKTKRQAAFHNPMATAGVCIDCHKAENAKGKKAPTKCQECHQKANA